MTSSVVNDVSPDRKGWRRKLKSDLKIIKGSYINKKNRTDGKLPICPICSNCNYKDFCHNRTDHSLMRKCGR